MRFRVDRCAGRRVAAWLTHVEHDALHASDLGPDPGDGELLEIAASQGRILITIDSDFGRLVF